MLFYATRVTWKRAVPAAGGFGDPNAVLVGAKGDLFEFFWHWILVTWIRI